MWQPRAVYRVQAPSAGNILVIVDHEGNALVVGGRTAHLNFGDGARAAAYYMQMAKGTAVSAGLADAQISYFAVPDWVYQEIVANSVPERLARRFPLDNHVADFTKSIPYT